MLIFWYVNSIWELESGSFSSREKRDPQWGKTCFILQGAFCPAVSQGKFLYLHEVIECFLSSKETSCWFLWALTGAESLNISVVLSGPVKCGGGFCEC